jgi:ribosome-associated protein
MAPEDDAPELPSKSQRKREVTALQELGEALVGLTKAQLARMALPARLQEAVAAAQAIVSRSARRRQLQYIGRLMREVDPEPIRTALDEIAGRSREAAARLQRLERWRERLIRDGDEALGALVESFPAADLQHVRRLVREARREQEAGRPPAAARALFRYLREVGDA